MADGFERMVDEALAFFGELKGNNSKDWFAPHKQRYMDEIKKPAEFFGQLLSEDIARITSKPVKPKLFRIYRDVRFSKDKTPLNTHLHMMWSPVEADALSPTWFMGLAQDYFTLGMGVMGLQGEDLTRYRAFVDTSGDNLSDALETVQTQTGASLSNWGPEPLKRVPKPYDADHAHADLLKRKSLAISAPIPENWREVGLLKAVGQRVKDLKPVFDMFDRL
ncbi:MAG: DUF2461 domain-containing protein [Aliishimia sp.]